MGTHSGSYYYCRFCQCCSAEHPWESVHVLHARTLRLREVKSFAQGHVGSKCWSLYLTPGLPDTFTPRPASRQGGDRRTQNPTALLCLIHASFIDKLCLET